MENRSFNILILLALFSSALFSIITPMAKELTADLNLKGEDQVAFINSMFLSVGAFCSIIWALLAVKFSRKILLLTATLEWSLLTLFTIFATDFYSFLIFQLLAAIGFGAALPLIYSLTIDLFEPSERGIKFGTLSAYYILGNGLGQILSGFLIDYYSWQIPLLIVAISGFICTILLLLIKEPIKGEKDGLIEIKDGSIIELGFKIKSEDLKKIWRIKTTRWILILDFVMFVGIGAVSSFFISMLKNDFNLSSTFATILLIIVFGNQIPSGIIIGKLGDRKYQSDKKGRINIAMKCLLFGGVIYALGFLLAIFLKNIFSFTIFFILILSGAFLFGGIDPLMQATLGEINPPEIRSTVYAINYLATTTFGRSLSLLLLGYFFIIFNYEYSPGYFILFLIALSSLIFFLPIMNNFLNDMENLRLIQKGE